MTLPQVIFRQVPSKALDFDGIDYYLAVADAANSDSPIFSGHFKTIRHFDTIPLIYEAQNGLMGAVDQQAFGAALVQLHPAGLNG